MATFLRFLIGLIGFVYVQAAVFGSIGLVLHRALAAAAAPLLLTGLLLLATVPLTAGGITSYTTWTAPESRRRGRRVSVALAGTMVVGAVLLVITLVLGVPGWFVLVAVLGAAVATPASIALGLAARRRDDLRPAGEEWAEETRVELRRGWRRGAIGFGIGLALGVLILATLFALGLLRSAETGEEVGLGLGIAFMGASIGMALTVLSVSRRLRQATSPEYDVRRRIARVVVRGKREHLDAVEQRGAARYARVIDSLLAAQTAQSVLLIAALVLIDWHALFERHSDGFGWIGPVFVAAAIALVVVSIPFTVARIRRVRAYAAAHPVTTPA